MSSISVNQASLPLIDELVSRADQLAVNVFKGYGDSVIIDAGVTMKGSFEAGRLVTEICMGGLGACTVDTRTYDHYLLPSITVETSYPLESLLGSQFAGWRIKTDDYFAMGSGPARALSLDPKELYEEIGYRDQSDKAVIILESTQFPTESALKYMADKCQVSLSNLYVVVAKTASIVGSVQISGRIIETGLHRLHTLGLNPKRFIHAIGSAPIAPIHPDDLKAMGRTNDVITYAGETVYMVDVEDEAELLKILEKAPSSKSKDYGRPFYDIFKSANFDFYQVDPGIFAPAKITINNIKKGSTYSRGSFDFTVLSKSLQYDVK